MSKAVSCEQAARLLKENDNYTVLTHAHPDGDTLGSGFALCEGLRSIGKKANVVCPDAIPSKFSYLVTEDRDFEPETVISVDVADEKLLGDLREEYCGRVLLSIDHHGTNTGFAENMYLEGDSAAACECVYKVLKELEAKITPFIASCLYTGIATDTGCFKFSNTTPRTHGFAAELIEAGADYREINRVMFEVKSKERLDMERLVLEGMEYFCGGSVAVVTVTREMIRETGCGSSDLDGITSLARQIEGVSIGITVREKIDGKWKISLRTFEPYDAAAICAEFGGGGHNRAAGCELDCSLEEAKKRLLSVVVPLVERA